MLIHRIQSRGGLTVLEIVVVFVILILVAAIALPILVPREGAPKSGCQNNLKELATALHMYWTDYDDTLPSSALHMPGGTTAWNARASAEFCAERGPIPPQNYQTFSSVHWPQALWPHMKNKDIIWCPSDPYSPVKRGMFDFSRRRSDDRSLVSYIYKPAVDRAWFGVKGYQSDYFRKEEGFEYVADQIVFFERVGYHWGEEKKGWREGVSLNAAFLDGHVRNVRLKDAADVPSPGDAEALAKCLERPGEPMWFNFVTDPDHPMDPAKNRPVKGRCFDPNLYYDNMP